METLRKKGILFDASRCVGCGACYEACKERNHLPVTNASFTEDKLSASTYTIVEKRGGRFVRRMCMHCNVPTCASVCPVGALQKMENGPVVYRENRCIGCRYCMMACPFSIPKYEWNVVLPRVRKCDLCADRLAKGLPTACAAVCPAGATIFGHRDELIKIARRRISKNPEKYVDHIYGLEEVGGTSVLLISDAPFEKLGYKTSLVQEPLPEFTWKVLQKIPNLVVVLGVLLSGIWWLTNRKNEVQKEEQEKQKALKKEKTQTPETAKLPSLFSIIKSGLKHLVTFPLRALKTKPTFWRAALFMILLAGLYSTVIRFTRGLGSSTALSDNFPWGLWIGFDVLCGVALAAGGFTLSAVVYIFNLERFRPVIRPAILTAFLGYVLVICALMFDLGRPYRIWHPLVMRNPHSVMFEVAWCVMLYTAVLALEFSPMLFERLGLQKPLRFIHGITIPLVIIGVILSTLHQSSLGSLYLIVPEKLHPLWYSPLLPVYFFVSAISLGCAMTIIESFLSARAFRKHLEMDLLEYLGKVALVALSVYGVLKAQDLAARGMVYKLFEPSYEGRLFLSEMLLGIIGPVVLLFVSKIRSAPFGLFVSALMVVMGFIMNRLNISITGMERFSETPYFPSWTEISITLSIVAAGFVLFGLAVKYLPVFPEKTASLETEKPEPLPAPEALRWPLRGVTGITLLLSAFFFGASLLLAYNGTLYRASLFVKKLDTHTTPDIQNALEMFKTPVELTFSARDESPGKVIFRHETHINAAQPQCTTCHNTPFSLLKRAADAQTRAGFFMHSKESCGVCHNGKSAFSAEESKTCPVCHEME